MKKSIQARADMRKTCLCVQWRAYYCYFVVHTARVHGSSRMVGRCAP